MTPVQPQSHPLRHYFWLSLLLVATFGWGQENYQSGYLVDVRGDTIQGRIDYRNWERNPEVIQFLPRGSQQPVEHSALTVYAFSVGGESYRGAVFEKEITPNSTNLLDYNARHQIRLDTAFLRVLIEGSKNLLIFTDELGKPNFYIERNGKPELLKHKRYLKEVEGKRVATYSTTFRRQLSSYFSDCPELQQKIDKVAYQRQALVRLFETYYSCVSETPVFQQPKEKLKLEFGVTAGVSRTQILFSSDDFQFLVAADSDPSFNIAGGAFLNLIFPRSQGKWSLYNELFYSTYALSFTYENYVNENDYQNFYSDLGQTHLKLNNMVRYKRTFNDFFFFGQLGLTNGLAISEVNYQQRFSKLFTIERAEEGLALEEMRDHEIGTLGGLGLGFRGFSLEFRAEIGNGMSEFIVLDSSSRRFYVLAAYTF